MQIKCDKCGAVATTLVPEIATDGKNEHTFFRCPDCGAVYPIAVTDDDLRKRIGEYNRRRQLIRMKPVTEQSSGIRSGSNRRISNETGS